MSTSNREGRTAHLVFRTSSYSGTSGNCVEVADLRPGAAVRDSQQPEQGHISVPAAEWRAFLTDIQAGRL